MPAAMAQHFYGVPKVKITLLDFWNPEGEWELYHLCA